RTTRGSAAMLVIYSAQAGNQELERLLDAYDRAKGDREREQVAEQVYPLLQGTLNGMIQGASQGRLDAEQLESLSWEALFRGLNESGVTRLKRSDGVWETFVEQCRQPGNPLGAR